VLRWLWACIRRQQKPEPRLSDVVIQPLPPDADDLPFEVRTSWTGQLIVGLIGLVHLPFAFGILSFWGWSRFTALLTIMLGLLVLLSALELVLRLRSSVRRISVNEQGLRVERVFSHYAAPWYAITRIEAREDLSAWRVSLSGKSFVFATGALTPTQRTGLAVALRARVVLRGGDIELWRAGAWRRVIPDIALNLGSVALGLGLVFLGDVALGRSLGFRCSGPSDYLQNRFGTPLRNGCTVLGVTGAAERAGVRQGDLVVEMDGIPITSGPQFGAMFENKTIAGDDEFTFRIIRGGVQEPFEIHVTMGPGGRIDLPDDDPVRWFLEARREGGSPKSDIEDYSRAIELAPDFDLAYLYRGELYHDLGDVNAGNQDYTTGLNLNWEQGEGQNLEARMWFYTGERIIDASGEQRYIEQALYKVDRAIEFHQCESELSFLEYNVDCALDFELRSAILQNQARLDESVSAGLRAIAFYPYQAYSYAIVAYSYNYLGDRDNARKFAALYLDLPGYIRSDETAAAMEDLLDAPQQARWSIPSPE
jgi:uncharacterized membrane protein